MCNAQYEFSFQIQLTVSHCKALTSSFSSLLTTLKLTVFNSQLSTTNSCFTLFCAHVSDNAVDKMGAMLSQWQILQFTPP